MFKDVRNLNGDQGHVVVSNLFAKRENLAIGVDLNREQYKGGLTREVYKRIQNDVSPEVISSNGAPVKENQIVADDVDIGDLPIIRHHEMDAAPYMTMAVVAKHPEWGGAPGVHNVSFHRMQYRGPLETGIHMSPIHTWHVFKSYEEKNLACPIAYVIGHHPMFYVSANMNPPIDQSEYDLAGGLMDMGATGMGIVSYVNQHHGEYSGENYHPRWHTGGGNYLWCDGHVSLEANCPEATNWRNHP